MTENEAIRIMDGATREDTLYMYDVEDRPYLIARAENMAVAALKEVQRYREIGTVEELKSMKENGTFTGIELAQLAAMQMRLKKYQAIGTVEEFLTLKEKSVAKRPIILDRRVENGEEVCLEWKCPVCGLNVLEEPPCQEYCQMCGNKLDWSE